MRAAEAAGREKGCERVGWIDGPHARRTTCGLEDGPAPRVERTGSESIDRWQEGKGRQGKGAEEEETGAEKSAEEDEGS